MNKAHARQLAEKHLDRYMHSDGDTIKGLLNEADWFFEGFKDVEYQLRAHAIKDHVDGVKQVIRVIISVDDQNFWSAVKPLCVSDFRTEGDLLWTKGTQKFVEEKRDRYPYASLHGEEVSSITPDCAFRALKRLEKVLGSMADRVVYAAGYTYKRKQDIKRIGDELPVNVITNKSIKTGLSRLIPYRADRGFLIKINRPDCLVKLFRELDGLLRIRYGILNKKSETDFLRAINGGSSIVFKEVLISEYMKNEDEHVSYKINTQGFKENAPFREYVSYGKNAPKELIGFHLKSEEADAI